MLRNTTSGAMILPHLAGIAPARGNAGAQREGRVLTGRQCKAQIIVESAQEDLSAAAGA
jgi:hypothetical protein